MILCQQENIHPKTYTVETNNNPKNKNWIDFDPKIHRSFFKKIGTLHKGQNWSLPNSSGGPSYLLQKQYK